ncbi:MAG: hypothetical protein ACR2MN_14580 [Acidimicrobiales bacterium]
MTARYHRWKVRAQFHVRRLWFWAENGWHRDPKAAVVPSRVILDTARREAQARNAAETARRLGLPISPTA